MVSSKGESKKGLMPKDLQTKCEKLLTHLEARAEAAEFLKPVNYKLLGLDDYPVIIRQPMDLSIVRRKLKASKYTAVLDLVNDLKLIWENCRTYNQIGSVQVT